METETFSSSIILAHYTIRVSFGVSLQLNSSPFYAVLFFVIKSGWLVGVSPVVCSSWSANSWIRDCSLGCL